MTTEREVINSVIESLSTEPEAWHFDGFYAVHTKAGIRIWIANGAWALKIEGCGSSIGGYPPFPFFCELIPWRRKLLAAIRSCRVSQIQRALVA